jgi:hypothetical protein
MKTPVCNAHGGNMLLWEVGCAFHCCNGLWGTHAFGRLPQMPGAFSRSWAAAKEELAQSMLVGVVHAVLEAATRGGFPLDIRASKRRVCVVRGVGCRHLHAQRATHARRSCCGGFLCMSLLNSTHWRAVACSTRACLCACMCGGRGGPKWGSWVQVKEELAAFMLVRVGGCTAGIWAHAGGNCPCDNMHKLEYLVCCTDEEELAQFMLVRGVAAIRCMHSERCQMACMHKTAVMGGRLCIEIVAAMHAHWVVGCRVVRNVNCVCVWGWGQGGVAELQGLLPEHSVIAAQLLTRCSSL